MKIWRAATTLVLGSLLALVAACGQDEALNLLVAGGAGQSADAAGGAGSSADEAGGADPGEDAAPARAKYVFFFIGDGMASVQVHAAEAYRAALVAGDEIGGSAKAQDLALTGLPVRGVQDTSSWDSLITDSTAAGTAMASGQATSNHVVGLHPTTGEELPTIAELARDAGRKIGIVTSASLDHATPASFYAHVLSRNDYYEIALQLVASGFDYFGGGGFLDPDGAQAGDAARGNVLEAAASAGYTIADTRAEFQALRPGPPAIAISPSLDDRRALYYEIDRVRAADPDAHVSLAEFTAKGVELLTGGSDAAAGFFLMVEGGKIDWACHENDARTAIDEVLALDAAVGVALDFQQQHPDDTLILVTGDHETGGMSLGWAGTGYDSHLERLSAQRVSYLELDRRVAALRASGSAPESLAASTLAEDLRDLYGLDVEALSDLERSLLDAAYATEVLGASPNTAEEDGLLYGGYPPVSITVSHLVDHRAGIGWTSFAHTAAPVPVFAGGSGAVEFAGAYPNTEIARKLAQAMDLTLPAAP